MKLKNAYFYTLREDARDEDSISGNLLVKAGYIKKTSAPCGGLFQPYSTKFSKGINNKSTAKITKMRK